MKKILLKSFYHNDVTVDRLKQIKEFHRRHPGEISVPMSVEFDELKKIRENPAEDTAMIQFR